MAAVEINPAACGELRRRMPLVEVVQCEIESFESTQKFDLVLCKGVLIHQHPSSLPLIYKKLARAAARDVLLCEYFSAQPVSLRYRGVAGGIWKRDFAAEFLEVCSDFVLEDYGFVYHLDFRAQFDNFNWFLLRRRKAELASG
jgi:pseudaminic acid biosynthesis-associated methylase